ncbi:TetR/AcrR family transcriptional regulator C-terminal ligand-binding domain-containing protein [Myxococcota bacterium]|nr:TetR/AcrR family transcriptional regulator C-terminal ligand-binding domain-containing protein [Myxococcota bacterium]
MLRLMFFGSVLLLLPFSVEAGRLECPDLKNRASSAYYKCTTLANQGRASRVEERLERCETRLERAMDRADLRPGCDQSGDAEDFSDVVEEFSESIVDAASGRTGIPEIVTTECDLSRVRLLDFEAWRREEGYWVGEYSFYGADGDPNQNDSWPYRYDHYMGFIRISIDGPNLAQRNVFTYPPQDLALCTDSEESVKGNGECGINGNENIWVANQSASNCEGSLDGPFSSAFGNTDTYTTVLGDDTVLYKVVYSKNNEPPYDELFGGKIMQNQLTTLTPDGVRVRNAQGFNISTGLPSYSSFYRETKVTEDQFWDALKAAREEYNILEEDECAWDGVTKLPSGTDCDTHFAE